MLVVTETLVIWMTPYNASAAGSKKKRSLWFTKRSCPVPERLPAPDADNINNLSLDVSSVDGHGDGSTSRLDMEASGRKSP